MFKDLRLQNFDDWFAKHFIFESNVLVFIFVCIFRAKDFDDLSREIAPPVIERLRRTYAHVDDIDLFPGQKSSYLDYFRLPFLSLSSFEPL
jgi:hypothetical protein